MKNITISLDPETADAARVEAAREGKSVSRWVGDLLRERLAKSREYELAMRSYFSRPVHRSEGELRLPKREELYDRPRLR
ncbi:MAG: hypothetical protein IT481_02385 [Gammaproteobacteria bacterium]|jgi:plasmid stability protein|nr:hypothetical protein [Gammaproteobacteria bacterium]